MRITVGIPSRGRPLDLIASVLVLDKLKSHGHQIEYLIAYDRDDEATNSAVNELLDRDIGVVAVERGRPLGLGELHNRMAGMTPADGTFLLWSDRIVPITSQWDHQISNGVLLYPNRVLWVDSIHLLGPGQFVLPPAWRAAQGDPCPGVFPFWFEDSALEEIDHYVWGFPRMRCAADCAGPRTQKTNRCRDIPFWISYYAALRPSRVEEARRIARKLGIAPRPDIAEMTVHWVQRDADMLSRADDLAQRFGAEGEPDDSYLAAKRAAEEHMQELVSLEEAAE